MTVGNEGSTVHVDISKAEIYATQERVSDSSQFSGSQSAFLNLKTAMDDLEQARDEIGDGNETDAIEWIDRALSGINSARAKIANVSDESEERS